MPPIKIAPSILSADKARLNEEIKKVEQYADLLHVDIMDGKFVEPTAFTTEQIKQVKTYLPMEAHLMVNNPVHDWIDDFIDAGCTTIIIHEESPVNILDAIHKIKSRGVKVGITIKQATPLSRLKPYIKYADMVLIMTVNPGYSGQKFIEKIHKEREQAELTAWQVARWQVFRTLCPPKEKQIRVTYDIISFFF